jgi:signal transduction histidine kinase
MHNITEKIKSQHYKELNRKKDTTLASVSHDLKTPINCMMSLLESAYRSKTIEENLRKNIKISLSQCHFMNSMINDIQDSQ